MGLTHSEEHKEFRRTARAFFEQNSPESEVRRLMETDEGYDPAVWARISELGLQSVAIPEQHGGAGYGFVETAIVLEEAGRALLCAPLLSSVIASMTLQVVDDESANGDLLPGIADGSTLATVAFSEPSGRWDADGITTTADGSAAGDWRLTGTKSFVTDGHTAGLILVPARTASGIGIFAVAGDADGMSRTLLDTLDQTRKLARIDLSKTPGRLIGSDDGGSAAYRRALQIAGIALANEQVGVGAFAMSMAAQYAKDRIQFGRPIGSFQAIKHLCADLLVAAESARSAAYFAASLVDDPTSEFDEVAALASSFCSEACQRIGHDNIQIHGGIGFTWEHPAHLYYKRAKSSEMLFGDPAHHRELVAQAIGL